MNLAESHQDFVTRVRAVMRRHPASDAARHIRSLDMGLVPYLADSHGPDDGQDTYDEVCREHGFDPLGWRAGVRSL